MSSFGRYLDELRRKSSEVENDLIDELRAGHIGRREFLRHGTVLGMSAPLLLAAAGGIGSLAAPQIARAATAGTVRVAQTTPSGAIDPVTVPDSGGVIMLCQTGEYLALSGRRSAAPPGAGRELEAQSGRHRSGPSSCARA